MKAVLLSPIYHPTMRCLVRDGLYSQWEDAHLCGAFHPCCRETPRTDPGGPTRIRHQVFGPLMLGKMPSHHKDEATRRTPVSSINELPLEFSKYFLLPFFQKKGGDTNLVHTVSLISNDGIFHFALNIQVLHGNIQSTYKPSKLTATSSPPSSSRACSPLQQLQVNEDPKRVCCPTRLTSEHLSWMPLINKWSCKITL